MIPNDDFLSFSGSSGTVLGRKSKPPSGQTVQFESRVSHLKPVTICLTEKCIKITKKVKKYYKIILPFASNLIL